MKEIGIAKVFFIYIEVFRVNSSFFFQFVVPSMACGVVDRAIQAFGAEGVSQDQPLAELYAGLRTLRLADVRFFHEALGTSTPLTFFQGPDAVHIQQVGQRELKRAPGLSEKHAEVKRKEKALLEKAGLKARL
jgi:acyl-CoA dehydrogenase